MYSLAHFNGSSIFNQKVHQNARKKWEMSGGKARRKGPEEITKRNAKRCPGGALGVP